MKYLIFLDHLKYIECIEAEEKLELMQIIDNHLWLNANSEEKRSKYGNLYRFYESIVKKVKEIKIIDVVDPSVYDYFKKKYGKKSPNLNKEGDKN